MDRAQQACCVLTERSLRQQPTGKTRKCLAHVPTAAPATAAAAAEDRAQAHCANDTVAAAAAAASSETEGGTNLSV